MDAIRAVCEVAAWLRERQWSLEQEFKEALHRGQTDRALGLCRGLDVVEGALAKCRQVATEEACRAGG